MRYDAAVIGAGADGLAAATTLAAAGLKTIVLERSDRPGGRLVTREFHPGFFASPFADELAPIPLELFWSLGLARHGAVLAPPVPALAVWPGRQRASAAPDLVAERRAAALALCLAPQPPEPRWRLFHRARPAPWPKEHWASRSLADVLAGSLADEDAIALCAAGALAGRAADPFAGGSALHLLAPRTGSGMVRGGLGRLGEALAQSARTAGAEIACGLDVTDVRHKGERATGLVLADGSEVEARAIVSTLDLKRTFLSLFSWQGLSPPLVRAVAGFRAAGATARLLFALDRPPGLSGTAIHLAPGMDAMAKAFLDWRHGVISEHLPILLRVVSRSDPGLAPRGAAVMTATVGCVPHTLFDGSWTNEKRGALVRRVLAQIEPVLPGISATVLDTSLMVPGDIEEQLGRTGGDLDGGDIAADQMFALRPWPDRGGPRTPVAGLYLAGPSAAAAPLATCASGVAAARTLIADLAAGRLP